jgi:tripartite-type tricarboxylate transporter receptor subunit TctC
MKELSGLAAACVAICVAWGAPASDLPDRPVKIIVPFPPGGTSDIVARVVANAASPLLPRGAIIENRSGAGGNIGAAEVARSPADGTVLLQCAFGPCAANPALYAAPGYDLGKDFTGVILTGAVRNVMSVRKDFPAQSVGELIALAKREPGKLTFGSSGVGASNHLGPELLRSVTGVEMTHVPYRGSAPAIVDLSAGRVDIFFDNLPSILPHIRAGAVRALAAAAAERIPELPDVPTFKEAGIDGMVIDSWFGFLAPAGTPAPAIRALNAAFGQGLADPAVKKRLEELGVTPLGGTPEAISEHVRSEAKRWRDVVERNKIRAE